jgi:Na+/proline symporter
VGIGTSIFLIAVGAILTFAVETSVAGIDLDVVGWILMAAGVLGLIMTTLIWGRRRGTAVTEDPAGYRRVEERREVGPPL